MLQPYNPIAFTIFILEGSRPRQVRSIQPRRVHDA